MSALVDVAARVRREREGELSERGVMGISASRLLLPGLSGGEGRDLSTLIESLLPPTARQLQRQGASRHTAGMRLRETIKRQPARQASIMQACALSFLNLPKGEE
ncbi:MAG: hypothetical protein SGPRY_002793 [Prymnesium sp.]